MIIRQATQEDVLGIKNIFDSLQVSRDSKAKWGFVEHSRTEEEIRFLLNPYCLVAETDTGIIGCNVGYDKSFLIKNYDKIPDEEKSFLLKIPGDFFYLAQAGVLNPKKLICGIAASEMHDRGVEIVKENGLYKIIGLIAEEPWKNERSLNFVLRKGYKRFDSVQFGNGLAFGAYELSFF